MTTNWSRIALVRVSKKRNLVAVDVQLTRANQSLAFEGLLAVCDTANSWAAKWLRVDGFQPGLYAVKVNGRLPEDIARDLEAKGVVYRPRDGSAQD